MFALTGGLVIILGMIVCAIFTAFLANEKNRSWLEWLILGALFGPLALITVGFMPVWKPKSARTVKCPLCAEFIRPEALVCLHCGRDVPAVGRGVPADLGNMPEGVFGKIISP